MFKTCRTIYINLAPLAVFQTANTQLLTLFDYHVCEWFWLERNTQIFHQKEASFNQLLDKIKFQSYQWLKANRHSFVFSYHSWWLNLLPSLGIFL